MCAPFFDAVFDVVIKTQEFAMSNFWNRLTQWLGAAQGDQQTRKPLVAWEASWDEAEALIASGKLWSEPQKTQVSDANNSVHSGAKVANTL